MAQLESLKDELYERQLVRSRLGLLGFVIFLLFALLVLRYHYLQIDQFERFATLSEENRVHLRSVAPTRGLIYDVNGVLLAENLPSYTLSIVPERAGDVETLIARLDELLGLSAIERERFYQEWGNYRRPYEAIPLRFRLTEKELALLAVDEHRLPGIEVEAQLIRAYPHGEYLAHVLGYVGRINDAELARIDREQYAGTHVIGKTGLERHYEDTLHGIVGYEHVETDARGNVLRVLDRENPLPGGNLKLFLDIGLQKLLQDSLQNERASAVVLDVETGGVMAMVSNPGFDPNLFVGGISTRNYQALLDDPSRPLFNRALQGQYPPGSTIKPMFGLAGLQSGAITPDFQIQDLGYFLLEGEERRFRDWKPEGHGSVDLEKAIEQSCDTFFYEMGNRAGIDILSRYGEWFGLGRKTGVDMPVESTGIMPSRIWKRGSRGIAWYPGDTINTSIGQGFSLVTPMQLAQMTATMARRGEEVVPRMVAEAGNVQTPKVYGNYIEADSTNWDVVFDGMVGVVHDIRGTAYTSIGRNLQNYQIAGKSGTAQVVGIAEDEDYDSEQFEKRLRDHALFVAFAPADDPQVAVSVIVENGEGGSSVAGPIARDVFDWWYANRRPSLEQLVDVD
jgi:penicillin-binding protein 2